MPQNAGKPSVRPTKQLCTAPTSATKLYMTKRQSLDAPISTIFCSIKLLPETPVIIIANAFNCTNPGLLFFSTQPTHKSKHDVNSTHKLRVLSRLMRVSILIRLSHGHVPLQYARPTSEQLHLLGECPFYAL